MAYWNAMRREWDEATPDIAGPIELYQPVGVGTENLPADANVDVEYVDEYENLADVLEAIDCRGCGRYFLSTPDRGKYTHYLNSTPGGVDVVPI